MIDKKYLLDHESLESAWQDREIVFSDSNRHCLSIIVAFYHSSTISIDDIYFIQKKFDMNLSKNEIQDILEDWVLKEYVGEPEPGFFTPTSRLYKALKRIGYDIHVES